MSSNVFFCSTKTKNTTKYFVYNDMWWRKAGNPVISEAESEIFWDFVWKMTETMDQLSFCVMKEKVEKA